MQSEAFRSEKRKRNMENTYHCYANRELSWLRFNERVLEEAEDSRLPLCERLSFLSIFQSNLDEFFMVRIGSLQDQMLLDKNARENKTNMTSGEQIDAALAFIHKLTARRDAAYNGLLEQLAEQGIRLLDFAHMEEESRTELEKLFRQDYLPLLSSFIISKKQAFPFLKNKGIYAVAVLSTKAEKKKIGIVPCGNEIFPRLVPVPGRTGCFILSEELILHFLPLLYKGYKVTSKTLTRITRNADIDADLIYDEDLNYRDHMAEVVKKRKKLAPVRLELSREIDEEIIQSLCKNLKLDPKRVFEYDSPLDHSFLFQIEDQLRSHTDLSFLTASKEIGLEATEVFRALDQGETVDSVKNLLVAPHCLQNRLLNRIDGEIKAAARGEGGYIGIKINSLTDKVLINKLIEASQAGVYIDMVVRGICCLRAGVPDETENIHIISIVGRYLEHSRIYIFGQGERARYYIGSADWMTRSTLRRVEIAAPVTAPALKARLQHIFDTMLADNCNARVQQPDGSYVRRMPGADAVDCQAQFYEEAYQANVHSSLK